VYSVLSTEYAYERGIKYYENGTLFNKPLAGAPPDLDSGEFYIYGQRISAGFVIASDFEGLNVKSRLITTDIQILCNPYSFDKSFLVGDLNDLAIHECSHLAVSGHNESFVDEDMKFRRSLRRHMMAIKAESKATSRKGR
jgi:hypothetical protein